MSFSTTGSELPPQLPAAFSQVASSSEASPTKITSVSSFIFQQPKTISDLSRFPRSPTFIIMKEAASPIAPEATSPKTAQKTPVEKLLVGFPFRRSRTIGNFSDIDTLNNS